MAYPYNVSNRAWSTLSTGIDDDDLSVVVADGSNFPSTNFIITIENERLLIDSRSGNTLTVNASGRGYGSTTPASHSVGVMVDARITAEIIQQLQAAPNSRSGNQYAAAEYTDTAAGGAVAVDWDDGNVHYCVLGNGAHTITFSNPLAGGRYIFIMKQPPSGAAGVPTFSPDPIWAGGTEPTWSTANGAVDIVTLVRSTALSAYVGSALIDVK
jgi:hypothetical protein